MKGKKSPIRFTLRPFTSLMALQRRGITPWNKMNKEMLKLNCELVAGKSFSISSTAAANNHEKMPVDIVDELRLRFWILAASAAIIAADAMSARLAF